MPMPRPLPALPFVGGAAAELVSAAVAAGIVGCFGPTLSLAAALD